MKKKIIIPIGIVIVAILLFVGLQIYLSKQSFRYYYHGILLPVSPGIREVLEERFAVMMANEIPIIGELNSELEECKKNGRCIICSLYGDNNSEDFCIIMDESGTTMTGIKTGLWKMYASWDYQTFRELMEYLGWWKDVKWWTYETPSGIAPDIQAGIFIMVELLGIIILFRKKMIKNKKVQKFIMGCTIVVMVIAFCTYVYGRLYFFPVYNELEVSNAPYEKKVVVKEYFYLYGWRMRQYYVEVFPGILCKASDVYDTPIEWMSFTDGEYLARWNEEEQRIEIGLKEKGSDSYDYYEYVTYPYHKVRILQKLFLFYLSTLYQKRVILQIDFDTFYELFLMQISTIFGHKKKCAKNNRF